MLNRVCSLFVRLEVLSVVVVIVAGGCSNSMRGATVSDGGTGGAGGASGLSCVNGSPTVLGSESFTCYSCDQAVQRSLKAPTNICCQVVGAASSLSACACSVCAQVCGPACTGGRPSQDCIDCMAAPHSMGCREEYSSCTTLGLKGYWVSVASSSDGAKLFAATSSGADSSDSGFIYRSVDSGATWAVTGAPAAHWNSVASSSDGTKLLAGSTTYLYRSVDSGATWKQIGPQGAWSSVASSSDGAKLVAGFISGTDGGYVYTSSDSGVTWTQAGNHKSDAWSVASSSDGSKLVAVEGMNSDFVGGYIYTSADSGATWTQTGSLQYWASVASSSDGSKFVAVPSNNYIYTSADSGATWTQTNDWPTDPTGARWGEAGDWPDWQSVASSSDGTKLVAGARDLNLIYTSVDSGATWTWHTDILADWASVASSSDGTKLVAAAKQGYLYTSSDSGATWTQR